MTSSHRPSPLRLSDASWVTTGLIDQPLSGRGSPAGASSSLDLVPAPRASDLQIVLRTRDHAAYYNAASNELSLQKRDDSLQVDSGGSDSASHDDGPLVPRHAASQSLMQQRFGRAEPLQSGAGEARCPTCARPWPMETDAMEAEFDQAFPSNPADRESPSFIAPNYFRLLASASTASLHNASSYPTRPSTPRNRFSSASGTSTPVPSGSSTPPEPLSSTSSAQGYYSRFFIELKPLGRGARGSVYLCQHVLNGNKLGRYAIKKIPVGDHAQSLLESLNEVHLMESLHHDNLIAYQHAWIESCQLSRWGPEVPTLFVLMMAANGGSLDDWIRGRSGEKGEEAAAESGGAGGSGDGNGSKVAEPDRVKRSQDETAAVNPAERVKIERLKAALRQRRANRSSTANNSTTTATSGSDPGPIHASPPSAPLSSGAAIHLLRTDEIYSLLHDILSGLSFLHSRGILHLDIKPGNVLLHWDEDSLIPRALLSDFGSSLLLHDNWTRTRSGHTGTMEYMSPEAVLVNPVTGQLDELSSKSDVWSVGMVLHLLVFFRLPWEDTQDLAKLRRDIGRYGGFRRPSEAGKGAGQKEVKRADEVLLGLLERMLQVDAVKRPSCKEVLAVLNRAIEARKHDDKHKRSRRHRDDGDDDDDQQRGRTSSLALYRPAALPPLPPSPPPHSHASASSVARNPIVTRVLSVLPPETAAVTLALFKCLSPLPIAYLFSSSRSTTTTTTVVAWQPDWVPLLILLLALVDLSTTNSRGGVSRRRRIGTTCNLGHLALLVWCVLRRRSAS